MKYVYHGSSKSNLKVIKPNVSTHMKNWVYATPSFAVATIFLSNKGNDLYYYLGGFGTKDSPIILVERKKDMFKEIFNVSGTIYKLNSENFLENQTGWSMEVVSNKHEEVVEEYTIDDVYNELIKLDKQGELKLYLYPDRPNFIPSDNSDLISKVKRWEKNGFNIQRFFDIYPELEDKYKENIEE